MRRMNVWNVPIFMMCYMIQRAKLFWHKDIPQYYTTLLKDDRNFSFPTTACKKWLSPQKVKSVTDIYAK